MSRFFSEKYNSLTPYTPGEQPGTRDYVKLNTNECPFPPSPLAVELAAKAAENLNLYSDPELKKIRAELADYYGVSKENVICGNGSDEILDFAFAAFCDKNTPAVFSDITYGFYPVFSEANFIPYKEVPLREDFTVDTDGLIDNKGTVFIANPNAPTGIFLPLSEIERILKAKKDNVVVVDEAYIDFGGESAVKLTEKYDNLLVTGTFSKSRSLAGGRLGFGIGNEQLINDLNTLRYSRNPYNVNSMTEAAGIGAVRDDAYMKKNVKTIAENREYLIGELRKLGFSVPDSAANFVFATKSGFSGSFLYEELKKRRVLVRHFSKPRIDDYLRITVGTREQVDILLGELKTIIS
ncbi:MAG: histidinol-phosphate transaminase [Clostridia bacterium]|nr:histidinol-phosphate transaminase [Clostridia bacterium]